MKTVTVNLGKRSYPIYIGSGILDQSELFQSHIRGAEVVLITNDTVANLYGERLLETINSVARTHIYTLPDGETHKNLETISRIFDKLLSIPCDRGTTLVALGGGVVGDITGFAAACYLRGIPYIHVPTTLLAQVDSSIGGKTGVNHPLGKNMIGAIHQPLCVISDTDVLGTLPQRELRAGLAEVLKYGFIQDLKFFKWLQNNYQSILAGNSDALSYAVEQSSRSKAEVVQEDERESGIRAILNFGHTFGHAIEAFTRYEDYLHGEAVAIGMRMAADFSWRLQQLSKDQVEESIQLIKNCNLPIAPPASMTPENFFQFMSRDKKVDSGKIRFITLNQIGQAKITSSYSPEILRETIDHCIP